MAVAFSMNSERVVLLLQRHLKRCIQLRWKVVHIGGGLISLQTVIPTYLSNIGSKENSRWMRKFENDIWIGSLSKNYIFCEKRKKKLIRCSTVHKHLKQTGKVKSTKESMSYSWWSCLPALFLCFYRLLIMLFTFWKSYIAFAFLTLTRTCHIFRCFLLPYPGN